MIAKTATPATLQRALDQARTCTDALCAMVRPEAFYARPIPERHRLIFYLGHLEAFDWNLMSQVLAVSPFHGEFDRLFGFGIDPEAGQLPQDIPADWPEIAEVHDYNRRARQAIDEFVIELPEQILHVALEHRLMHAETFSYLLHDLPLRHKTVPLVAPLPSGPIPLPAVIQIPAGTVTLGQRREYYNGQYPFGWDNEFDAHEVAVPAFAMSKYKVTNGDYLEFIRAGAKPPHFWAWRDGQWFWRTMSGQAPLPLDWPVYVTHEEAGAYANWTGKKLPTEAQFHRAAYGIPGGEEERVYPWGDDRPDSRRGNFNGDRWDPVPVNATPLGDSAFGVSQLVGNGWEWTSTAFHPFPGFQPLPFYPGYSARFFDGDHYVLKGASPRTDTCFLRRSFRNWFRPNYPYVYAGFRCVEN